MVSDEEVKDEETSESTALVRLTNLEIEERREQVQKLRLRGISIRSIAKIVQVSPNTVQRDLAAIRSRNSTALEQFEQNEHVGEALSRFEEVEERAWSEYHAAKKPSEKLSALNLIRTVQNDKLKALIETGFIQKDTPKAVVEHTHKIDWTPDMQDRIAEALLESTLNPQLEEPYPDAEIIDVAPGADENLDLDCEREDTEAPDG